MPQVSKEVQFFISVHLWRYEGGYPALTEVMSKLRQNKVRLHGGFSKVWLGMTNGLLRNIFSNATGEHSTGLN